MSIVKCEESFKSGSISIKKYREEMYELHSHLFEYSKFIKDSYISSIEIKQDHLILKLTDGINLIYHLPDRGSAAFDILSFKSYESDELSMILNLLEPGMVFFDIGANIGWHTINIASQNETFKIYAFEPINATFNLLKENIYLNNLINVELFNIGLSDKSEDQIFYFDEHASAFTSSKNNLEKSNIMKITSKVERLDDFLKKNYLTQLDFIKCDVEGAELLVFKGGLASIKKFQPMVMVEMVRKWTSNFNYHPNEIIQFFSDLNYRCFRLENGKLIDFPFMDEDILDVNYLFLHRNKHTKKIKKNEIII